MSKALTRAEVACLILLTLGAFGIRLFGASATSLAEDEATIWESVQQYAQGHFAGVNSEHPMLLKTLAWASYSLGERWNHWASVHSFPQAAEETWLRLPNLIFGALTTPVLFLLAREMIGDAGAWSAAFFWAFTPLPIMLNRVLKEDTPLAFFTLLAIYFFWLAKRDPDESHFVRWLDLSAICFGLSMASKYVPLYFGLNALVWHVAGGMGLDRRGWTRHFWRVGLVMGIAFVVANPVILAPSNLASMLHYLKGIREHYGYNLDGTLYLNIFRTTPFGIPPYFYLWALAVKTPLPVLVAFVIGGFLLLRDQKSMASIFFRAMVLITLLGMSLVTGKWFRYLVSELPFIYLAAGYGCQKLYDWYRSQKRGPLEQTIFALALLGLLVWPLVDTLSWFPYYQLYLNGLGGSRSNAGRYFGPDEINDVAARQEVAAACRIATPGAGIALSNPMSAEFYLPRCHRPDIQIVPLFDVDYVPRPGDVIVLQDSRRYYETEGLFDLMERMGGPHVDIQVRPWVGPPVTTARIYQFLPVRASRSQHPAKPGTVAAANKRFPFEARL